MRFELIKFEETDSTNRIAKDLAREGREALVIARRQSAGRGRLARTFDSREGGLYMSLSIRTDVQPQQLMSYPLYVSLAVRDVLKEMTGTAPDIKWPNDLQLCGKKICGILCESILSTHTYMIVGVGINVYNKLPEDLPAAASVLDILGIKLDIESLAEHLACRIADIFETALEHKDVLLKSYKDSCITIGASVEVPEKGIKGIATDIDSNGCLLVKTPHHTVEAVNFGDVTIIGK